MTKLPTPIGVDHGATACTWLEHCREPGGPPMQREVQPGMQVVVAAVCDRHTRMAAALGYQPVDHEQVTRWRGEPHP